MPLSAGGVFVDENSNPAQNATRYKIAALDSCGNITELSPYHKTIHLTISKAINGGWNLMWDKYEGFSYSTFNIYRGNKQGELVRIAEIPGNTFSYTDLAPPAGTLFYQIEVINSNPSGINILKSANASVISSRSNEVATGITDIDGDFLSEGIHLSPNPATDKLFVIFDKTIDGANLTIFSMNGQIQYVERLTLSKNEIDISNLNSGLYMLRINIGDKIYTSKFAKKY